MNQCILASVVLTFRAAVRRMNTRMSSESKFYQIALGALILFLGAPATFAQSLDTPVLRRRQEAQERAREATRELVSSILDIQLQQLSENGLQEMPVFRDVQAM